MNITVSKIGTVLSLLLLMGLFSTVTAQETNTATPGIDFHHGTFAEAKAKAAEEKKVIFVDAYAQWCRPCRWMAANTFTDGEIGNYFNQHFISMKLDMEKGEGPKLARGWGIRAYPTLLFFDANGKEIHRDMGAKEVDQLMSLGKKVVKKKKS